MADSKGYFGQVIPEPGSIRDILVKNGNTRLFVHPLDWTADHIEALEVNLATSASVGERISDETKRQVEESTQFLGAVLDLERTPAISRDQQTRLLVKSAADAAEIQQDVTQGILFLEYDKRPIAQLPRLILACHQTTETLVWAYTDHEWTSVARRDWYRKKPWSFAFRKIKSKQGLAIDPIYIAVLITLAQQRRKQDPQEPRFYHVRRPFR